MSSSKAGPGYVFQELRIHRAFSLSAKVLLEVRHNECCFCVQHCAQCYKDINISLVKASLLGGLTKNFIHETMKDYKTVYNQVLTCGEMHFRV